jgi:hypothetical protein
VLLQLLGVTVQLELLARRYPVRRDYAFQAAVLLGMLGMAAASRFVFSSWIHIGGLAGTVVSMGCGMLAYALVVMALTWRFPRLSGLDAKEVALAGRDYLRVVLTRGGTAHVRET